MSLNQCSNVNNVTQDLTVDSERVFITRDPSESSQSRRCGVDVKTLPRTPCLWLTRDAVCELCVCVCVIWVCAWHPWSADSEQLMAVSYNTVSGSLNVTPELSDDPRNPGPRPTNTSCSLVFDGVGLTEDALKDWLRLCTKQVGVHTPVAVICGHVTLFAGNKTVFIVLFQRQTKKPRKTKNTLSPEEIKVIHVSVLFPQLAGAV